MHLKKYLSRLWIAAVLAPALSAQIVLDNFNSGTASGSVLGGTSWAPAGYVTQNATSITIGGVGKDTKDDNGWGASVNLNATGMAYITVTGQRDSGNAAANFSIEFHDIDLNTATFSVPTSLFAFDAMTTVNIPIISWGTTFNATQIADWSIGGGTIGVSSFRMTLDNLQLTAVPEPSTYAALAGLGMLAAAIVHKRRRARQA